MEVLAEFNYFSFVSILISFYSMRAVFSLKRENNKTKALLCKEICFTQWLFDANCAKFMRDEKGQSLREARFIEQSK